MGNSTYSKEIYKTKGIEKSTKIHIEPTSLVLGEQFKIFWECGVIASANIRSQKSTWDIVGYKLSSKLIGYSMDPEHLKGEATLFAEDVGTHLVQYFTGRLVSESNLILPEGSWIERDPLTVIGCSTITVRLPDFLSTAKYSIISPSKLEYGKNFEINLELPQKIDISKVSVILVKWPDHHGYEMEKKYTISEHCTSLTLPQKDIDKIGQYSYVIKYFEYNLTERNFSIDIPDIFKQMESLNITGLPKVYCGQVNTLKWTSPAHSQLYLKLFKDGKDSCIDSNHLKSGSSGTVTYDKKDPGKYVSKFYFSNVPIGPTFTFEVLVPDSLPETSTTNPPTAPRENLELENCELQERIGEGEFAEVYTANFHNTVVAVKLFKNKFKRDIHRLVETEVNKLAQLRHPNVIQYMGTIVFQNRPGIVMEKMKMSLDDVLVENNEISIQTKKKIFIDIAQALCFIHSLPNSYHGDLKPANVLLNGEITNASTIVVKLCDFSQARIRFAVTSSISSATTIYTPRYAAPELSLGLSKTSAIDIFSFGILIWESLTGETPFLNEENVCKAICGGDRPSVKNFDKNVSNLLTAMWQGKPDQRPSISTVLQKMKEIF